MADCPFKGVMLTVLKCLRLLPVHVGRKTKPYTLEQLATARLLSGAEYGALSTVRSLAVFVGMGFLVSKNAARESRDQVSKLQEDARLDDVLRLIQEAKDDGAALSEISKEFPGELKPVKLKKKLGALLEAGKIRGPFKDPATQESYYFAAHRGPSVETVRAEVIRISQRMGNKIPSEAALKKEIKGIGATFLKAAIVQVVAHRLDAVLPLIQEAQDNGVTLSEISNKIFGQPKSPPALARKLQALAEEKAIREPLKYNKEPYYFGLGRGPSAEGVSEQVVQIAKELGSRPPSEKALKGKVTGIKAVMLDKAIQLAVRSRAVLPLDCGGSMFYVHREVAEKHFGQLAARGGEPPKALLFEDILPAYRRLKAEQGGLSTVKIFDLMTALKVSKDALHDLLKRETKAERLTIHHSNVTLAEEVMAAGIHIEGIERPFVTVVIKRDA
jgi:hypothetical protein